MQDSGVHIFLWLGEGILWRWGVLEMNGGACYAIDIIHVATRLESTYME